MDAIVPADEGSTKIDPLLGPILQASGADEAANCLPQLFRAHLEPVIDRIICYKLRLPFDNANRQPEADDLHQEATLQLLAELQKLRQNPDGHPIGDVRGLAAVIAYRVCSRWMRRRYPERHSLKNRLRYLLTRQNRFALWQNDGKRLIAGYAEWRGRKAEIADEQFKRLIADASLTPRTPSLEAGRRQSELSAVLIEIFDRLGGPIEFDKLVGALAEMSPATNQPMNSTDTSEDALARVATGGPDAAWRAEKRIFLQRLWEELRQLPLHQRTALLLNLKDAEGCGCIALFPATGVATIRQLAETIEMRADEFARLWNDLPLEDARIAEFLHLTRQQVINARKSARERLTRKLRGFL